MANLSFTENQSTLAGPNQKEAASGSVSGINGLIHYRFKTFDKIALFGQFSFPLLASEGTYISGGAGGEYYFGRSTSKMSLRDSTTSFVLTPITRFFASAGLNMAYISYKTETAQKSDTLLELEVGGGMSRKFSNWTLRAQLGVGRGVGVATSTFGFKGYLGGIFFLD